jgi:hypothetical protein
VLEELIEEPLEAWPCPLCTCLNKVLSLMCEACGNVRPANFPANDLAPPGSSAAIASAAVHVALQVSAVAAGHAAAAPNTTAVDTDYVDERGELHSTLQ